jgi:hypothetical protein
VLGTGCTPDPEPGLVDGETKQVRRGLTRMNADQRLSAFISGPTYQSVAYTPRTLIFSGSSCP